MNEMISSFFLKLLQKKERDREKEREREREREREIFVSLFSFRVLNVKSFCEGQF